MKNLVKTHRYALSLSAFTLFFISYFIVVTTFAESAKDVIEQDKTSTIQFLTFVITDDSAELYAFKEVPGKLKSERVSQKREGLQVKAISLAGSTVYEKSVDNPLWSYLEYEDPSEPGRLLGKVVEKDTAYVTVRISGQLDYRFIELSLLQPQAMKGVTTEFQIMPLGRFEKATIEQFLQGEEK